MSETSGGRNGGPCVLDVPPDWVMPKLGKRVVPAGGQVVVEHDEDTLGYYDTVTGDLAELDIVVSRGAGPRAPWTLRVEGTASEFPPAGRGVPAEIRDMLLGVRGGAALRVAERATRQRTVHRVFAADGAEVGTVTEVTLCRDGADAAERQVEIQGWQDFADAAVTRLVKADAVERLTGADTGAASTTVTGSVGAALLRYLREQRRAVLRADLDLRRGEPEVHAFRVAIRRTRSALRVVTVADREQVAALDGELRWLSGVLGAVRDLEVLREHLADSLATLTDRGDVDTGATSAVLTKALDDREAEATTTLRTALAGRRYLALLRALGAWCESPPFDAVADEPEKRLARYVRTAAKDLDKRLAKAGGSAHKLHQARKAAKRARYVASFAGASAGPHGAQVAKRAKALQNGLGDHQDHVLAAEFVAAVGTDAVGSAAFGCGVLWSYEQARADAALRKARATRR